MFKLLSKSPGNTVLEASPQTTESMTYTHFRSMKQNTFATKLSRRCWNPIWERIEDAYDKLVKDCGFPNLWRFYYTTFGNEFIDRERERERKRKTPLEHHLVFKVYAFPATSYCIPQGKKNPVLQGSDGNSGNWRSILEDTLAPILYEVSLGNIQRRNWSEGYAGHWGKWFVKWPGEPFFIAWSTAAAWSRAQADVQILATGMLLVPDPSLRRMDVDLGQNS